MVWYWYRPSNVPLDFGDEKYLTSRRRLVGTKYRYKGLVFIYYAC